MNLFIGASNAARSKAPKTNHQNDICRPSIGRCPDHGSCAQYSIFRRVHPTDFDRLTARLPGRPRNELARRLGYTPLASLVSSAGTVFAAIDGGVARTLQTLNPASGITFVFLIFVVFR